MKKVGFLLGSFDPIHMGHLYMITSVLNEGLVDDVVVVPTMQNVWKQDAHVDFQHRCFMAQLATEEINHCTISSLDYRTPEPHYSYQVLQLLKEEYSNRKLYLIVGADIINDIKSWAEGQWILDNFSLIVIDRPSYDYDKGDTNIDARICISFDISSTYIRTLISENKQIYPLVPKAISQYIHRFNLYKGE